MNAPAVGIPKYISDIKEIDLTTYGRIRLMCFPEEAVQHARDAIRMAFTPKNPFALFFKYCTTWCSQNNIYPDYELSKQVAISNKCSIDDKLLNSTKVFGRSPKTNSQSVVDQSIPKVMSSMERLQAQRELAAKAKATEPTTTAEINSEVEQLKSEIIKLQDKIINIHTLGIPSFLIDVTLSRYKQDLEFNKNKLSQLC